MTVGTRSPEHMPLRAGLRRLVEAAFPNDPQFDAFCIDYFPEIAKQFGANQDHVQKLNHLLRSVTAPQLLAALREAKPENAAQYDREAEETSQSEATFGTSSEPRGRFRGREEEPEIELVAEELRRPEPGALMRPDRKLAQQAAPLPARKRSAFAAVTKRAMEGARQIGLPIYVLFFFLASLMAVLIMRWALHVYWERQLPPWALPLPAALVTTGFLVASAIVFLNHRKRGRPLIAKLAVCALYVPVCLAWLPKPFSLGSLTDPCVRLRIDTPIESEAFTSCRPSGSDARALGDVAAALAAAAVQRLAEPTVATNIVGDASVHRYTVLWITHDRPDTLDTLQVVIPKDALMVHLSFHWAKASSWPQSPEVRSLLHKLSKLYSADVSIMISAADGDLADIQIYAEGGNKADVSFLPQTWTKDTAIVTSSLFLNALAYASILADSRGGSWPTSSSVDRVGAAVSERASTRSATATACSFLEGQVAAIGAMLEVTRDKAWLSSCWPNLTSKMRAAVYVTTPEPYGDAMARETDADGGLEAFARELHGATTASAVLRRVHVFDFQPPQVEALASMTRKLLSEGPSVSALLACTRMMTVLTEPGAAGVSRAELARLCLERAKQFDSDPLSSRLLAAVDIFILDTKIDLTPPDVISIAISYLGLIQKARDISNPLFRSWILGLPLFIFVAGEAPERTPDLPDVAAIFKAVLEGFSGAGPLSRSALVALIASMNSIPAVFQQVTDRLLSISKQKDALWWAVSALSTHPAPLMSALGGTLQTILSIARKDMDRLKAVQSNSCKNTERLAAFIASTSTSGFERTSASALLAANIWLAEYVARRLSTAPGCPTGYAAARDAFLAVLGDDLETWEPEVRFSWNASLDFLFGDHLTTYLPYYAEYTSRCNSNQPPPLDSAWIASHDAAAIVHFVVARGMCIFALQEPGKTLELKETLNFMQKDLSGLAEWTDASSSSDSMLATALTSALSTALRGASAAALHLNSRSPSWSAAVKEALHAASKRLSSTSGPFPRWLGCFIGVLGDSVKSEPTGNDWFNDLTAAAMLPCQNSLRDSMGSVSAEDQAVGHLVLAAGQIMTDQTGPTTVRELETAADATVDSELVRAATSFGLLYAATLAGSQRDWAKSSRILKRLAPKIAEHASLWPRYKLAWCLVDMMDTRTRSEESPETSATALRDCLSSLRGAALADIYGASTMKSTFSMSEPWRGGGPDGRAHLSTFDATFEADPLGVLIHTPDNFRFKLGLGWKSLPEWAVRFESGADVSLSAGGPQRTADSIDLQVALLSAVLGDNNGPPKTEHLVIEADRLIHIARDEHLLARSYFRRSVTIDDLLLADAVIRAEMSRCHVLAVLTLDAFIRQVVFLIGTAELSSHRPLDRVGVILKFVEEQTGYDAVRSLTTSLDSTCAQVFTSGVFRARGGATVPAQSDAPWLAGLRNAATTIARASQPEATAVDKMWAADMVRVLDTTPAGKAMLLSLQASAAIDRVHTSQDRLTAEAILVDMDSKRHDEAVVARSLLENRLLFSGLR